MNAGCHCFCERDVCIYIIVYIYGMVCIVVVYMHDTCACMHVCMVCVVYVVYVLHMLVCMCITYIYVCSVYMWCFV